MKSAAGAAPWPTEAWYTLNAPGSGNPFDPPVAAAPRLAGDALKVYRVGERVLFRVAAEEPYLLKIFDSRGALEKKFQGRGEGAQSLAIQGLARGAHAVVLETRSGRISRLIPNY